MWLKYLTVTSVYGFVVAMSFGWVMEHHRPVMYRTHVVHHATKPKVQGPPEATVFEPTGWSSKDHQTVIHEYVRVMPTFKAYILTISNPKQVSVVTTKYLGNKGQTVENIVKEQHALAGINGGSFLDTNWQGTGGQVQGIVISDGKILSRSTRPENIIGFTDTGRLISGMYTLSELESMHVTQALMFGPTLVSNGVGVISGAGDGGYAPRTAIGQRSDGTVIMIVTDGRYLTGGNDIGASYGDIEQLMLQYGAVTAANLDGGSSATMYVKGQLFNEPTDILGERSVATAVIVR